MADLASISSYSPKELNPRPRNCASIGARSGFGRLALALASIAVLAFPAFASPARANDTPSYSYVRIVRLSYVEGDVQIVRADHSNKWEPAAMNMPVEQGFAIGTNNGRAEVEFENGSMLWLAPDSVVQFSELALSNGGRITRMMLSEGVASFDANLATGDTFEVSTPMFSITSARKAEFRVGVRDKSAAVSVLNGRISVGESGEIQAVAKGQMFVDALEKHQPKTALMRSPAPDQWDHWVNSRLTAERYGLTETAAKTNAPFTYGMADLADYGSWNFFPGYGYGWQPWGMMAGWAPFMDGQWMFYPTLGWTWVSGEPWGWMPYHFGGWDYSPVYGWMWFPGGAGMEMWTAAPVQWYSVGNRVGWTPRSVNFPRTTSVTAPVIVGTKKLGKEGRNLVFGASEVSARMQSLKMRSLQAAPQENGRPWRAGEARVAPARIVVPTAANLQTLRTRLAANTGTRINVNGLHPAASSRVMVRNLPERNFGTMNAAMAAPRISRRPPMRATYEPPRMGEGRYSGQYGTMSPTVSAPAVGLPAQPAATAMPAATSHPAPGRPR